MERQAKFIVMITMEGFTQILYFITPEQGFLSITTFYIIPSIFIENVNVAKGETVPFEVNLMFLFFSILCK